MPVVAHRRRALLAALAAAGVAPALLAQDASASIRLIVPTSAGGSVDALARLVAGALSGIMEVPVRVENIPGDAGVTGTNAIARAPHDGSVIGMAVSSPMTGGKLLSRNARFNPIEDFDWLALLGTYANAMIVASRSNVTTFEQWLAAARAATTPLTFGTFGTGSPGHLAGAYLRLEHGANLRHVSLPVMDEGYAMLTNGRLDVLFDGVPNAMEELPRSGHRVVAVTSSARLPAFPDIPAFGEIFQQAFVVWIGLVLPKGVPPGAYAKLAGAVSVLLSDPRHAEAMRAAGVTFMGLSGAGTRAFVEAEFLRNARLIARLNDDGLR
ncbi:MAG: tripartite tricarboxylate transporter substrate binding protein [Burkholderiales bacterium]